MCVQSRHRSFAVQNVKLMGKLFTRTKILQVDKLEAAKQPAIGADPERGG